MVESAWKTKRWLITGGAGFIGCNLIKRLLADGVRDLRVLDNLSVGSRADLGRVCRFVEVDNGSAASAPPSPAVELVVGDIRHADTCLKAARGVDLIVHLAANTGVGPSVETPRLDMEANVIGILNMLEAARQVGVKRFIFASSGAPVGECTPPIHEELATRPVSPYGASKLAGEGYCSAYYRTFGVETVSLRFGNVYGPLSSHKSSVVAKFIRQTLAGERCEIYGDGTQTRDFIFIDDLIRAILAAAQVTKSSFPWGEAFQIATSTGHTVNEIAAMLQRELKAHNLEMRLEHGASRLGDVKQNFSDTTKAKTVLGWQAQVPLVQGLKATIQWFCKSNKGNLI